MRSWLKPGDRMSVEKMGTHFGGTVDLNARVAPDGNSIEVKAKLALAVSPTQIRVHLRSGDGRPLASAAINGAQVLAGDVIALPNGTTGEYRIVGRF